MIEQILTTIANTTFLCTDIVEKDGKTYYCSNNVWYSADKVVLPKENKPKTKKVKDDQDFEELPTSE